MTAPTHYPAAVDAVLLALRLFLGPMIFAHGYRKFFRGGRLKGTAGWFASIGMRQSRLNAVLAASTETGVGVLLFLGLFTPLACAGLIALMVTAIITVHWKNGFFIFNKGEGIEYTLGVAVSALVPATLGPGRWSLDHAWHLWHWSPAVGLVVGAGLGVGGSLAQLATFYRSTRQDTSGGADR
jgi:putative oxidoreductase